MVERSDVITAAVTLTVFVDADTGYGNAMNVIRTSETYGRSNAGGIMLEGRVRPKCCRHLEGKRPVPLGDLIQKISAFQHANQAHGLAVIARIDAIAAAGFDEAVLPRKAYARAGADLVFIESPRDDDERRAMPKLIDARVLANMVEGSQTPVTPASGLQAKG
jgi:2,3-dimethylmalate lyase